MITIRMSAAKSKPNDVNVSKTDDDCECIYQLCDSSFDKIRMLFDDDDDFIEADKIIFMDICAPVSMHNCLNKATSKTSVIMCLIEYMIQLGFDSTDIDSHELVKKLRAKL